MLLGLTLAISRGRQNWARWVLLVLYVYVAISVVTFSLIAGTEAALIGGLLAVLPGAVLALAFTKQSSAWLRSTHHQSAFTSATRPNERHRWLREIISNFRIAERPGSVWTLSSGGGAAAGAWIACVAFPSARFAQNPVGHFSWALVGFAWTIGLGFGAAQSAILVRVLRSVTSQPSIRIRLVAFAWNAVTAVGVFVMIFPLWWTYTEALLLAPGYLLAVMMPGVLLLAILQWALIRSCSEVTGWLWRTALGGAIGGSMGLMAAIMVRGLLPLPMEAEWAGSFGLLIGAMQAKTVRDLMRGTGAYRDQGFGRENPMSSVQPISSAVRKESNEFAS